MLGVPEVSGVRKWPASIPVIVSGLTTLRETFTADVGRSWLAFVRKSVDVFDVTVLLIFSLTTTQFQALRHTKFAKSEQAHRYSSFSLVISAAVQLS